MSTIDTDGIPLYEHLIQICDDLARFYGAVPGNVRALGHVAWVRDQLCEATKGAMRDAGCLRAAIAEVDAARALVEQIRTRRETRGRHIPVTWLTVAEKLADARVRLYQIQPPPEQEPAQDVSPEQVRRLDGQRDQHEAKPERTGTPASGVALSPAAERPASGSLSDIDDVPLARLGQGDQERSIRPRDLGYQLRGRTPHRLSNVLDVTA